MEMVSTITSLITNVVNFAGGLLLLFGAVTLDERLYVVFRQAAAHCHLLWHTDGQLMGGMRYF